MTIQTRTQYVCSICGRVSTDRAKIEACETSHLMADNSAPVIATYAKGTTLPGILDVTMADGSVIRYLFAKVVALPPEKKTAPESEAEADA